MSAALNRRVVMGRVVGVHGVAGQVKIESFASPREAIFSYRPWFLCLSGGERLVEQPKGRAQGKGMIAEIPGFSDPEAARALFGAEIQVMRSALPQLPAGEYYWIDLKGLRVLTLDGVDLGVVDKVFATGANDVMVVKGDRERLLPFVQGPYVKSVDIDGGIIQVDWDPDF